jgi:hypothetical protein
MKKLIALVVYILGMFLAGCGQQERFDQVCPVGEVVTCTSYCGCQVLTEGGK